MIWSLNWSFKWMLNLTNCTVRDRQQASKPGTKNKTKKRNRTIEYVTRNCYAMVKNQLIGAFHLRSIRCKRRDSICQTLWPARCRCAVRRCWSRACSVLTFTTSTISCRLGEEVMGKGAITRKMDSYQICPKPHCWQSTSWRGQNCAERDLLLPAPLIELRNVILGRATNCTRQPDPVSLRLSYALDMT